MSLVIGRDGISMYELFAQLVAGVRWTGDVKSDAVALLLYHGYLRTANHSERVAAEAKRLAARYGENELRAEVAGLLHDVSAVFPNEQRGRIARELGLAVLPEEERMPMILHQKISAVMAQEIFGVRDEAVLSAIGCHTTLKINASKLDKVVFVADKIAWDQSGTPSFLKSLLEALEQSLDAGVLYYLRHLWQRRDTLLVVHPWFVEAYRQLSDVSSRS